jgi:hypothetical protein
MSQSIVAYFSHSYRPEDRAANMAVWRRLNAAGLEFAVDPPSRDKRPMDVTFLERMMQRSHCFIAIVPNRSREAPDDVDGIIPTWSPYQALEYRLALRVDKPRLVIVEQGIGAGPLPKGETVVWFKRANLALSDEFDSEVEKLVSYARSRERPSATMPNVGILCWRPTEEAWSNLALRVSEKIGEDCEILAVDEQTLDNKILARARDLSVLIVDMNPRVTPAYLVGMLHGAGVPMYRTCLLETEETAEIWAASLGLTPALPALRGLPASKNLRPRLLNNYQVDPRVQPVLFWNPATIEESTDTIVRSVGGYWHRENKLQVPKNGREYFLSLRGNRVFISTPGNLLDLTAQVKEALDDSGMPAFHYRVSTMPGGREWRPHLEFQINSSDLFLGFITESYWERAECIDEMEQAIDRWERHEMLIVLYASDPLPPLPAFFSGLQANRFGNAAETCVRVVAEVRDRFNDGAQESTEKVATLLTELISRHAPLEEETRLAAWLGDVCRLEVADAQRIAKRAFSAAAAGRALELVGVLLATIPVERYQGRALGRLCLHLRKLEPARAKRAELSKLFSSLRLFPKLHDIHAWIARQRRGAEVILRLDPAAPRQLLESLLQAAGHMSDPVALARSLGQEIAKYIAVNDKAALAKPGARVCVACNVEHLAVPLEWAVPDGLAEPLSRARPVFRRVEDLYPAARRAALEQQFHSGLTGPPRVLLFGHATASLPHVTTELNTLETLLTKRYGELGWPAELVYRVPSNDATGGQLAALLAGSDYEVVHLVGHAGFDGGKPVIQVAAEDGSPGRVTGEELSSWLRTSAVRFVYLSCCEGAATDPNQPRAAGWQQSLCKDLLEAGVPEVLGYIWQVGDTSSVAFTKVFYDAYFPAFDAPGALYAARHESTRSDALWASSILVKQDWRESES